MSKTPNITTIMLIASAVLVTLQIKSCFDKSPINERAIRNEMKLEALEEKRKYDSLVWVEKLKAKDVEIEALKQKDTVFVQKIIQSNDRIKQIPVVVSGFDKSELRRAITNY